MEEHQSGASAPVIVATPHEIFASREVARQVDAMRKAGIKLDRAPRPGGYYLRADGTAHDAEGRPILTLEDEAAMRAEVDAREAAARATAELAAATEAEAPATKGKKG